MINAIILLQAAAQPITQKIEMSQVGWVDIVFLLIAIWALIAGYRSGFIKEISKFVSVLTGLFLTFQYYESASMWIKRNSFVPQEVAVPICYVTILIVTILITFALLQFLGKLFEVRVFQLLEKLGGMILGLARYALILGLITHFLFFFPVPFLDTSFKTNSITGPYLLSVCPKTYKGLSKFIVLPKWQFEPQVTIK